MLLFQLLVVFGQVFTGATKGRRAGECVASSIPAMEHGTSTKSQTFWRLISLVGAPQRNLHGDRTFRWPRRHYSNRMIVKL